MPGSSVETIYYYTNIKQQKNA